MERHHYTWAEALRDGMSEVALAGGIYDLQELSKCNWKNETSE
jgi:hypothetical protein